jgi:serine/threonine protein kinase
VIGTPDYLAPEVLLGTGHSATVDWWALGVVLFEMFVGIPPFHANDPVQIFKYKSFSILLSPQLHFLFSLLLSQSFLSLRNIIEYVVDWDELCAYAGEEAADLVSRLLIEDPSERLGHMGAQEVPIALVLDCYQNIYPQFSFYLLGEIPRVLLRSQLG